MKTVIEKAYAKINLGLDVVGTREDGYHLVKMIMQTVGIRDTLRFEDLGVKKNKQIRITLKSSGRAVPDGEDNLITRAIRVMDQTYGIGHDMAVVLDKQIPVAAGMAGGSTDAAAAFRAMRELFVPEVSDTRLQELALSLGADIPYCIAGGTQLAEGIGEKLTALPDAPQCSLVIVKPEAAVPTGGIYRAYDALDNRWHPDIDGQKKAIMEGDLPAMAALGGNVLELVTGARCPQIGQIEKFFMGCGALQAMMTGSGPTVFAVFDDPKAAEASLEKFEESSTSQGCSCFQTEFVFGRR